MKLEIDDEVFGSFAFYGSLLVFKMLAMPFLTAKERVSNGVSCKTLVAFKIDVAASAKGTKFTSTDIFQP